MEPADPEGTGLRDHSTQSAVLQFGKSSGGGPRTRASAGPGEAATREAGCARSAPAAVLGPWFPLESERWGPTSAAGHPRRVTLAAGARSGPALPAPRRGFRRPALRLSLGPKMFRAHRLDARSGGLSVGGVRWGGVTQSRGDVKWRTRAEGAGGSGPSRLLRAVFAQRRGRL